MNERFSSVEELIKEKSWATAMNGGLDSWANYSGPDYSDYIMGPSRSRDSHALQDSNFECALKDLGGETKRDCIVARFGHWGVGWIECIMVHKRNKKRLEKLRQIWNALADYPILDDTDYSEREHEALEEYVSSCFGFDKAEQKRFISALVDLGCDYNDNDGSIYIRENDVIAAKAKAGITDAA